jgi:hypothetical protein
MRFLMCMGGWEKRKLYFSFWGFLSNEDGPHEWVLQVSCIEAGIYFVRQPRPN